MRRRKFTTLPRIVYFSKMEFSGSISMTVLGTLVLLLATTNSYAEASSSKFLVDPKDLHQMLKGHFGVVRSHLEPGAVGKEDARQYIKTFFKTLADKTEHGELIEQSFERLIGDLLIEPSRVTGINYIYTLRGTKWGTSTDRPMVLGAHYDTEVTTPGVDDNGSGMVSLLSTAKYITEHIKEKGYTLKYTLIFVAFDFEEMGDVNATDFNEWQALLGSNVFVSDYLVPGILDKFGIQAENFQGAMILDTILNWSNDNESQNLPPGADKINPDFYQDFVDSGSKGNFINIGGRESDTHLADSFTRQWSTSPESDKFLAVPMLLPFSGRPDNLPIPFFKQVKDMFRSDHYRFWNYGGVGGQGLNAVLITDSAMFRGNMKSCYHQQCDDLDSITEDKLEFLSKITHTVAKMMLAASEPEKTSGAGRKEGSFLIKIILIALVQFTYVTL